VKTSAPCKEGFGHALNGETPTRDASDSLLDVRAVAGVLGVSASWVRRHASQLPCVRVGRMVRFDSSLLFYQLQAKMQGGKPLKPERTDMFFRYQRGFVYQKGRKVKVWYARIREDVRNPDGQIERRHRNIRLGTLDEYPTKSAARNRLSELLKGSPPKMEMSFRELSERWEKAEGSTMKATTLHHYKNALRAYVLPKFGDRKITEINREDIQTFLAEKARKYSESTLRSMRVVLGLTLGWATNCSWLARNPCSRVKLPKRTGGRRVTRTVLTAGQVNAIAGKLKEPYATLVLFLAATGLRIGEALAIKWTDFKDNVLHVTRRIYDGDVDAVKSKRSERKLPIDPILMERIEKLGRGEWVFRSRTGTSLNPGNALKRYIRPAAKELGISLGGWHDFRHTLSTKLRRSGVHPKVVSDILGHKKVNLAMDVYDRTDVEDFVQPLSLVVNELCPSCSPAGAAAMSQR
jgi:integrase